MDASGGLFHYAQIAFTHRSRLRFLRVELWVVNAGKNFHHYTSRDEKSRLLRMGSLIINLSCSSIREPAMQYCNGDDHGLSG